MKVTLHEDNCSQHPLETLYLAYKEAVTKKGISELAEQIAAGEISRDAILTFIQQQADIGHTSPFYFIHFTFLLEGVSRATVAQLQRHHVGTAYEERSYRYVKLDFPEKDVLYETYMEGELPIYIPPEFDASERDNLLFAAGYGFDSYRWATNNGVKPEKARYSLPMATETQLMMDVNYGALLKIADDRLCTQAQDEIRDLVKEMRRAVIRYCPELGRLLAPKCAYHRGAICNESLRAWKACPMGGLNGVVRPHKSQIPGAPKEEFLTLLDEN